jgi:glucose-6-phosphate isomerase
MAKQLAPALSRPEAPDLGDQDSSTAALIRRYRTNRGHPV